MADQIIEPVEDDEFARAADAIIAKRGTTKLKPPPAPPEPRGPERWEVAEPDDTLAVAFRKGFDASSAVSGMCCGCNTEDGSTTNPYDGSRI